MFMCMNSKIVNQNAQHDTRWTAHKLEPIQPLSGVSCFSKKRHLENFRILSTFDMMLGA